MNARGKLAVALGVAVLGAPFASFAQQESVGEAAAPSFYQSTTNQNISRPEQNSAADVLFLKGLTNQANSMIGKRANEVAEIAQSVQAKLDGEQMKSLLDRLHSNPDNAFRLSVQEQVRALRTFTAAALEHVAKMEKLATPPSKEPTAQTR